MIARSAFIAAARAWLGTPWHHQGAVRGVGCDCAGLVMGAARACGLAEVSVTGYPRIPRGHELEEWCDRYMARIPRADLAPGDVCAFDYGGDPQHLGILGWRHGAVTLIHAYAPAREVVEVSFAEPWIGRLSIAYRIPGLDPWPA